MDEHVGCAYAEQIGGHTLTRVLSCVLTRLIDVNEKNSCSGQHAITKFHAQRAPSISISCYLDRIRKFSSCSDECFVIALIYIDRVIEMKNFVLSHLNVHRMVITSVLLAAKYFDDHFYNNAYYARVGGVPCSEMNSLELEFLNCTKWQLYVSPELYEKYHGQLVNYIQTAVVPRKQTSDPTSFSVEDTPMSSITAGGTSLYAHAVAASPTVQMSLSRNYSSDVSFVSPEQYIPAIPVVEHSYSYQHTVPVPNMQEPMQVPLPIYPNPAFVWSYPHPSYVPDAHQVYAGAPTPTYPAGLHSAHLPSYEPSPNCPMDYSFPSNLSMNAAPLSGMFMMYPDTYFSPCEGGYASLASLPTYTYSQYYVPVGR